MKMVNTKMDLEKKDHRNVNVQSAHHLVIAAEIAADDVMTVEEDEEMIADLAEMIAGEADVMVVEEIEEGNSLLTHPFFGRKGGIGRKGGKEEHK
jgi:hypothetical protein